MGVLRGAMWGSGDQYSIGNKMALQRAGAAVVLPSHVGRWWAGEQWMQLSRF